MGNYISTNFLSPVGAKLLAKDVGGNRGVVLAGKPQYRQGYTAVFLGDSITAGSGSSGGEKQQWPVALCMLSKGKIRMLRNAGVVGETSGQILARVDSQVVPYAPDLCFVCGFTNDTDTATAISVTLASLEEIFNKLISNGIVPIFISGPPYTSTTANKSNQENRNSSIKILCDYMDIVHIDPWKFVLDEVTGDWITTYTSDNKHPKPIYYRQVAQNILNELNIYGSVNKHSYSNVDASNKISNGLFLNGTTTPTGWNNVSGTNNCVPTIEDGGIEVEGNYAVFSYPSASTGSRSIQYSGSCTPGDLLEFSCKVTSFVESGNLDFSVIISGMDAGYNILPANSWRPAFGLPFDMVAGVIRSEWVAPVGATRFAIILSAGSLIGGVGTVKFAEARMVNKTDITSRPISYPWV